MGGFYTMNSRCVLFWMHLPVLKLTRAVSAGMRPTETRHSPELRQARQERQVPLRVGCGASVHHHMAEVFQRNVSFGNK